jgi:hypothetical protein
LGRISEEGQRVTLSQADANDPAVRAPCANTLGEAELRAAILRMAAEQPEQSAAVGVALLNRAADQGDAETTARADVTVLNLPHSDQEKERGKIIQLDRLRKSAG